MSIEAGKNFGVTAREKSKERLRGAAHAITIVAAFGIAGGLASTANQCQNDKEARISIDTQVLEARPRKVSEEQYALAQQEIAVFEKNKGKYVDLINIPQHIEAYNQLIEKEDTRSQMASQLKGQLKSAYDAKVSPRKKRDRAIFFLSSGVFIACLLGYKLVDIVKKNKPKASSPESTEP